VWYYGQRVKTWKYENIIQILEQSDNIQYIIVLIDPTNQRSAG
jgi:hypothetical protein